jgi:hypothetical protein
MLSAEYLAGLFDGEGWVRADHIHYKGRKTGGYQLALGIAMTYEPVIRMLHEQFGGVCHGDDSFKRRYHKNRTIWRWHVASRLAVPFLKFIEAHSVVKKEQITLGLALQAHIELHKPMMVGLHRNEAFKTGVRAEREVIAAELRRLKKVDYLHTP